MFLINKSYISLVRQIKEKEMKHKLWVRNKRRLINTDKTDNKTMRECFQYFIPTKLTTEMKRINFLNNKIFQRLLNKK